MTFKPGNRVVIGGLGSTPGIVTRIIDGEVYVQPDGYSQDEAFDPGRLLLAECLPCGEGSPRDECPKSKRPCGHHCNHSWTHDKCDWCEQAWDESA